MPDSSGELFNALVARAAQMGKDDAREGVIHPLAERMVADFDLHIAPMLDALSEDQVHFMWCSIEAILENLRVALDSELALRIMYLVMLYGFYLGRDGRPIPEPGAFS